MAGELRSPPRRGTSPLASRVGFLQACRREEVYRVAGGPFGGEVREDLADDAAELVAVPGEPAGDRDLLQLRVQGDHEVQVRGVGVHADPRVDTPACEIGEVLSQVGPKKVYLLIVDFPVYRLSGCGDAAGPVKGGLHASLVVLDREAVEPVAVVRFPDVDGEAVREERLATVLRLEPVHHLPLDLERETQIGEQLWRPGAGRDHEPLRLVGARLRLYPDPISRPLPRDDRLIEPEVGA